MTTPIPSKEQLTAGAAMAFVLSVGAVSAVPTSGTQTLLVLSAISFVSLYASG